MIKITDHTIDKLIRWAERCERPVVYLDSQSKEHPESSKSFIAVGGRYSIEAYDNRICYRTGGKDQLWHQDPWKALDDFRKKHADWSFGYLGYNLKNWTEDLVSENPDYIEAPDLFFFVPELLIEIDTASKRYKLIKGELPEISSKFDDSEGFELTKLQAITKRHYIDQVKEAKRHIYEGDYYEINISHQLSSDFEGDTWNLFNALKQSGQVPFAAYFSFGDFRICCASPERFLARSGIRVWSQPIKGTAEAGSDSITEKDKLSKSEKIIAENLMTVDLVRNDLSRVALPGTVKTKNLFEIQSFETVHQMVSTVEAKVEQKLSSIEILKACFPVASMTGAPKIEVMKSIEEIENYKRAIYSGSIGYFTPAGDFDFNVVIRTAIINQRTGRLFYPVGGAITSDSDPVEEWEETLLKAKSIIQIQNKLHLA